jgi:hypothetical protein
MSKVTKTTVKRIVNFLHLTNEMFNQSMIMLKHILCKTLTGLKVVFNELKRNTFKNFLSNEFSLC